MNRHDGWWGLVFVVGLFVFAAMASLPTAAESGDSIKAFYSANRQVIIVQQVLEALLVVPLLGFAVAMDRRARQRRGSRTPWILIAGCALIVVELATNVLAFALATMADPSPGTMHTLTLIADLADALLFIAIALFSALAALAQPTWVRIAGLLVGAVALIRAFASPMGATMLDAAAPMLFLVFVGVLSVRMLILADARRSDSGSSAVG